MWRLEPCWYSVRPPTWFAALVPTLAGVGGTSEPAAAAGAVVLTGVLLWLACGQISLDSASRLSERRAPEGAPSRRGLDRIPGFHSGEAYVVATLIRAQFRHDLRFRLAILGVMPMTVFYMFLGWKDGLLADPFTTNVRTGARRRSTWPLASCPWSCMGRSRRLTTGKHRGCSGPPRRSRPARCRGEELRGSIFFLGAFLLTLACDLADLLRAGLACGRARRFSRCRRAHAAAAGRDDEPRAAVRARAKARRAVGPLFWLFMVGVDLRGSAPAMLPLCLRAAVARRLRWRWSCRGTDDGIGARCCDAARVSTSRRWSSRSFQLQLSAFSP